MNKSNMSGYGLMAPAAGSAGAKGASPNATSPSIDPSQIANLLSSLGGGKGASPSMPATSRGPMVPPSGQVPRAWM